MRNRHGQDIGRFLSKNALETEETYQHDVMNEINMKIFVNILGIPLVGSKP